MEDSGLGINKNNVINFSNTISVLFPQVNSENPSKEDYLVVYSLFKEKIYPILSFYNMDIDTFYTWLNTEISTRNVIIKERDPDYWEFTIKSWLFEKEG